MIPWLKMLNGKNELRGRNVGYRESAERLTAMGIPEDRKEHRE
jgi:hypothetical protein